MNAVARPRVNAPVQLELHLESFDGPLELLLLLIEQRRLPITQVSLAQVADQYVPFDFPYRDIPAVWLAGENAGQLLDSARRGSHATSRIGSPCAARESSTPRLTPT